MSTIPILTEDVPETRQREPTLGGGSREPAPTVHEVPTDKIKAALGTLTTGISTFLTDVRAVGDFKLKQVTVTVEINAEGKVFLVGKAGAKGGVTLTFEV